MENLKCFLFLWAVLVLESGAYADGLGSDGFLRKSDGSLAYFTQYDALNACPKGTHLPSVRELLKLSQARGAKGILELDQVNGTVSSDYFLVNVINFDGTPDKFYFSSEGYIRSEDTLGTNWIWSSSLSSSNSDDGLGLWGRRGDVFIGNRNQASAVLCLLP